MNRNRVRDALARLHALLPVADIEPHERVELTLHLMAMTSQINRGPVLALPWRVTVAADRKCLAAHDDTFLPHE
jgi:hypothetical protein